MSYGGASPSATLARAGKGKDEMAPEMAILPLYTRKITSIPPRLSPLSSTCTKDERGMVTDERPLHNASPPFNGLARSLRVKEENSGEMNGPDQVGHLNPTV
jgi:hypothetical protein